MLIAALGLSIVHTNKTLRKLYDLSLISWRQRTLKILEEAELARIARFEEAMKQQRPFI